MKKLIYENKKKLVDKLINEGEVNLNRNVVEILINRGFDTPKKINKFLNLSFDDMHNALLLPDCEKACKRICQALENDEEITVYGDYDVDGCLSTSVLVLALRNLGARVNYWTNNRFDEGYGINPLGVEHMFDMFPNTQLVITCDNGIVAYDGVDACNKRGVNVIVTDHHEANDELPNAYAVVNPKRKDSKYPFRELCGTGVAFKLMYGLYFLENKDLDYIFDMLDMVALATVADIVPLIDENRIIVKEGLRKVIAEDRYIFESLRKKTNVKKIDTYVFGFVYAPMINALGRLKGSQMESIKAFISDDEEEIDSIVTKLFDLNEERKELTITQMEICEKELEGKDIPEVIFVYNDNFHEGVVGLIAGRLKEKYCRPTFVFTKHGDIYKGSARSIDGFNIKEVLDVISDDLVGYGGHAKAGGVSVAKDKMEIVKERLINLAKENLTEDDFIQKIHIDTILDANNIQIEDIESFEELAPFGEGFRKPLFGLNNFKGNKVFYMGEKNQHFKVVGNNITVIGFNLGDKYKRMHEPLNIKVIGTPNINIFNSKISLQFNIENECISKY